MLESYDPRVLAAIQATTIHDIEAERAKRHLRHFVRQAWHVVEPATQFVAGWHIDCICEHLEAVTNGELRNLIINVPPRHMKSLCVSVFWPVWEWIRWPERRWLFASYAESLSVRDSLKSRRLIQSVWFQERWGHVFRLTSDQNVKSRYENDRTGYRIASSVGGANTGEGGDRIVADDPHNINEAESELVRESVLRWWDEVMSTRLNDPRTSARVIIMQRCHENDLTGHLLEQGGYHHLCLPARYEPRVLVQGGIPAQPHDDCAIARDMRTRDGELLWPGRFGETELAALERDLGPYAAAAQLQQRPVPREGAVFRSDWFRPLPSDFDEPRDDGRTMRQRLRVVQFWDLAFSEKTSADYTAAVTVGVDASQNVYVLHAWRGRVDEANLDEVMAEHITLTKPHVVGVEESAYRQAATRDLVRRVQRRLRVGVGVLAVKVTADKVFRAQLPAGRAKAGMVYADRTAPWWAQFEAELLAFPRGKHDDLVDALSGAVQMAVEKVELPRERTKKETYTLGAGAQRQPEWPWGELM